jgi:predicted oxidoreductase
MNDKIKKSQRLRHTLEIAEKCGFVYEEGKYIYGGFFDSYQTERILQRLKELELKIAGLTDKQIKKIGGGV